MRLRVLSAVLLALGMGLCLLRAAQSFAHTQSAPPEPETPMLRVLDKGAVLLLPPEEYLVGVVAAEMPADFAPEALRAQAVAARTYTLYCMRTGRHAEADVCTDYRCCQAWKSPEDADSRVRGAVEATRGEYLQFAGQAAFTAFHSSSPGFTEDCGAIWNGLPYLVSVASPESAETVPNYISTAAVSAQELRTKLLTARPEADFSVSPSDWVGEAVMDDSGRVSELVIGGAAFSGVELRTLFGLRSTAFTLDYADGVFTFTVTGFGHGVGMSQYGANVMASQGADYRKILAHYYPGTELVRW